MSNFIQSVDERTQLAGANRLEILLFSLGLDKNTGREEVFGLNVFKIREVIQVPEITRAPDMPPGVIGMVIGTLIGAKLMFKVKVGFVRWLVILLLFSVGVKMVIDGISRLGST